MSKGSGRRRVSPADGIIYDEENDITNIEQRGARAFESMQFKAMYADLGAEPTAMSWYGSNGQRRGGRGRKNDHRSWKTIKKGKQYEVVYPKNDELIT